MIALFFVLAGCQVYDVSEDPLPATEIPSFFGCGEEIEQSTQSLKSWWHAFEEPQLSELIETALCQNFDVLIAWDRLYQARANHVQASSFYLPELSLDTGYSELASIDKNSNVVLNFSTAVNRTFLRPSLFWELDLWGKIDSQAAAARKQVDAACYEIAATQLIISALVADFWLTIQEQTALIALLHQQLEVSHTLLSLVEMRFSLGQTSALDLYQQKQQLQSTKLKIPLARVALEQAKHQLNVLLGKPPCKEAQPTTALPKLPPFPNVKNPCSLLMERPDLQAAAAKLTAADYQVAAAVANRLPSLSLSYSYDFSASHFSWLFDREVSSFVMNIFSPLLEWGRRGAEVDRAKAFACQELHFFSNRFLTALSEVEGAIVFEKEQLTLLQELQEQLTFSQQGLRLAQQQYANGLIDYLSVITAIQALQEVERRLISEKKNLLSGRVKLYLSLGGPLCCN